MIFSSKALTDSASIPAPLEVIKAGESPRQLNAEWTPTITKPKPEKNNK
jgi:hypothetical protein